MAERRDLRQRLAVVLCGVEALRLEQLDPRELAARRSHHRAPDRRERQLSFLDDERAPRVGDRLHEREQLVAVGDARDDRRLIRDNGLIAGLSRRRIAGPVEPAGRERLEQCADPDRCVDRERERCPVQHWHWCQERIPRRRRRQLEEGVGNGVDVPGDLHRIAKRRRRLEPEQQPCLARVLQHVRRSVDHERRHRRRAICEPPFALLADHDRLELHVVRTKELLGQAADRSAGVRVQRERTLAFAQLALEDLAGRRARQLVDELDRARQLVARRAARARTPSARRRDGALPGRATTSAFTVSPQRSSGTPITAASATSGCWASASSTSIGYTFSPPLTIMSLIRSVRKR